MIAARTVSRDTPITRAITLIGICSARCSRRISAQSSTESTPSPLARPEPGEVIRQEFRIRMPRLGQYSRTVDTPLLRKPRWPATGSRAGSRARPGAEIRVAYPEIAPNGGQ